MVSTGCVVAVKDWGSTVFKATTGVLAGVSTTLAVVVDNVASFWLAVTGAFGTVTVFAVSTGLWSLPFVCVGSVGLVGAVGICSPLMVVFRLPDPLTVTGGDEPSPTLTVI